MVVLAKYGLLGRMHGFESSEKGEKHRLKVRCRNYITAFWRVPTGEWLLLSVRCRGKGWSSILHGAHHRAGGDGAHATVSHCSSNPQKLELPFAEAHKPC